MTRIALLLVLLLGGCPSPGLVVGVTGIKSQAGYTSNTRQLCERADLAMAIADRALPIALAALQEAGYAEGARLDGNKLSVCLIRDPEPCTAFGWTAGPCLPGTKTCARKRGCATSWTAWGSICWPPVCTAGWPSEPHCKAVASTAGWELALVHELFNLARARWAKIGEPDYSKLPALFGEGGVESKVMAAYGVPRHRIEVACGGSR